MSKLEGRRSDTLLLGPQSVIQGSTLSCTLFLIFILDFPDIFHEKRHDPKEMSECKRTNAKTFVDDAYLLTRKEDDLTMQESIEKTMKTVENYMQSNELALNKDKTQIMLITDDDNMKKNLNIEMKGKIIKHQNELDNSWKHSVR